MSRVTVFFSYSHQDEDLRDKLERHLGALKRQGVISSWHDRQILPGDEWDHQINEHLRVADIILLLISSDFLASDYCYDVEVDQALERHQAGEARVIPILLRDVYWENTPFAGLQALPSSARPIMNSGWASPDEAFANVAKGIADVVRDFQNQRTRKAQKQYRDLVLQFLQDGEISSVEQDTLDEKREEWGLTPNEAGVIQNQEVERLHKRNANRAKYEKTFRKVAETEYPVSEKTRISLRTRQEALELSDEEVSQIETQIKQERQDADELQRKLEDYRREFQAVNHPIDEMSRVRLEKLARSLGLRAEDTEQIHRQVAAGGKGREIRRTRRWQGIYRFFRTYWIPISLIIALLIIIFPHVISRISPSVTPFPPGFEQQYFSEGERTFIEAPFGCKYDDLKKKGEYEKYLQASLCRNDPEAIIYRSNDEAKKAQATGSVELFKIAAVIALKKQADLSQEILRGVAIAQEAFNRFSNDKKLVVTIANEDDTEDTKTAEDIARFLAEDRNRKGILGVIGHFNSTTTQAAAPSYEENGLVAISVTSTAPRKTETIPNGVVLNSYMFRTALNDSFAVNELLKHISENGYRKVVVIHDNTIYSEAFKELVKNVFPAKVNLLIPDECNLSGAKTTFNVRDCRDRIRSENADVLLFIPGTERNKSAKDVVDSNVNSDQALAMLGGDTMYDSISRDSEYPAKGMVIFVSWHRSSPLNLSKLEKDASDLLSTNQINWRTAMAYDATQALIEGLRIAKQQNCEGIACRRVLRDILAHEGLKSDWGDPTRIVKFDSNGDREWNSQGLGVLVKVVSDDPQRNTYKFARCNNSKCDETTQ